jgi:Methylase involved in ubiquinone/menaquinone biosynthesis
MKLTRSEVGGVHVFACEGELGLHKGDAELLAAVESSLDAGARRIVLDLTRLSWLDSAGIGAVVACSKRAADRAAIVRVVSPPRRGGPKDPHRDPPPPGLRSLRRPRRRARGLRGLMDPEIAREIARTLETEPRLLPVLPDLLADLDELGTSAEEIVSALRRGGVPRGGRALDLGCGKGAVAVALAERLGLAVEGVDAFPPSSNPQGRSPRRAGWANRAPSAKGTCASGWGRPATSTPSFFFPWAPSSGTTRGRSPA